MKKIFLIILASSLFAACGNKKTEPEAPAVNPLWGMWALQEPATDAKVEMLFTEDSQGFVFVADTMNCYTIWSEDSLLKIRYVYRNDSVPHSYRKFYKMKIDADTLFLDEVGDSAAVKSRFVRSKG